MSWPGFNVQSSGDAVAYLLAASELSLCSMCTLLVTQTVVCLILDGELALFLLCSLLITHILVLLSQGVSCLPFGHELLLSHIISLYFFKFVSDFFVTVFF